MNRHRPHCQVGSDSDRLGQVRRRSALRVLEALLAGDVADFRTEFQVPVR